MQSVLLFTAMAATFLGIVFGTRAGANRSATSNFKFWLNFVIAIFFAVVSDQLNTLSWPTPMQMSQSLEAMSANPGIFAAFSTAALATAFFTSWCLSYGAGMWNARHAAKVAAKALTSADDSGKKE
jgi:hypothetical protein